MAQSVSSLEAQIASTPDLIAANRANNVSQPNIAALLDGLAGSFVRQVETIGNLDVTTAARINASIAKIEFSSEQRDRLTGAVATASLNQVHGRTA